MELTEIQVTRIKEILHQWHEYGRAEFEREYTNLDYDSPMYTKSYRVGEKYIHLLNGTSGAFMVEVATGIVYEIKGWGVPNKRKIVGEAWKPTFNGAQLADCRYIRGSYDNRAHLWVPKEAQP